jgi:hypothetical protein
MPALEWRVKLAVLWLAQAVNYAAYVLITLAETGSLGTDGTETGLLLAIFFFIPCAHAVIKLGAVLGLVAGPLSTAVMLNELWAFVAAALIVWCAWRYPKREA